MLIYVTAAESVRIDELTIFLCSCLSRAVGERGRGEREREVCVVERRDTIVVYVRVSVFKLVSSC